LSNVLRLYDFLQTGLIQVYCAVEVTNILVKKSFHVDEVQYTTGIYVGGVFSKTEMSEVLTEIIRMDPTFDKEQFIKQCQFDIIPNILEVTIIPN
jgi:hypothetical protein